MLPAPERIINGLHTTRSTITDERLREIAHALVQGIANPMSGKWAPPDRMIDDTIAILRTLLSEVQQ